jgi:large subunit ribosomal protein L18
MDIKKLRLRKIRRARRVRAKIKGTKEVPRLAVYRSNKNIYAQLIDDENHNTLLSSSSLKIKDKKLNKTEMAKLIGKLIAEKAKEQGISKIVFDRRSYKYHGRVKALAEALRENGLIF